MDATSVVTYCSFCSKPFTVASSHKRHISYCKRTKDRPKKRKSSCRACNHAKAKCSFGHPCSRCASRSVECVYEAATKRPIVAEVTPAQKAADGTPTGIEMSTSPDMTATSDFVRNASLATTALQNDDVPLDPVTDADIMLDEAGLSQVIIQSDVGQKFFDTSIAWDTTVETILQNNAFVDTFGLLGTGVEETVDETTGLFGNRVTPEGCVAMMNEISELTDLRMEEYRIFNNYYTNNPFNEGLISPHGRLGNLGPLKPFNNRQRSNASLVLQSLRAFPQKMLNREDPPFFIHAYKHLETLPEPLAVCSRICHMFATRTPEITPFIWRCIRSEEQRFLNEPMNKEELLAASQAQVVYIIMMVIESGMRKLEWVQEMLLMSGAVCQRLFMISTEEMRRRYEPTADTTWEEWLYLESRKRKLIVWFIMSLIFSTQTGIACNNADEIRALRLPAPRLVWESTDPFAWKRHLELENSSKMQTLGDLIDANAGHPHLAKELDVWNAKSDQLGSLLNVAISILR